MVWYMYLVHSAITGQRERRFYQRSWWGRERVRALLSR
jgi:hypothetical protein